MTGSAGLPAGFGGLAAYEFEETAFLAVAGCFLVEKCQVLLVEFFEENFPWYFLKGLGAAITFEIYAQHAGVVSVARSFYMCLALILSILQ